MPSMTDPIENLAERFASRLPAYRARTTELSEEDAVRRFLIVGLAAAAEAWKVSQ